MELASHARAGVTWNSVSMLAVALLGLFQVAVAARFLGPEDFGLVALLMVVVGFAGTFADLGTAGSLLHHQRATRRELDAVHALSAVTGLALAGAVWAVAPLCEGLWGAAGLARLLRSVAPVFVFGGLSQVPVVLLRRELRFRTLARLEMSVAGVQFACVVAGLVAGGGVAAIAWAQVAAASVRFGGGAWLARDLHLPRLAFSWDAARPHLGFGLYQLGERLVNFASWNLDKMLIGLWLGTELLGAYHLAYQLMIRPFRLVAGLTTRVSRPLLARLRDDRERMLAGYFTSVRIVAFLAFPLYVGAFVLAGPLVSVIYGPGWEGVAGLFRWLCPLGILYCIGNPIGAVVVATGRARIGFWWNVYAACVQLAAVTVGVRFGVEGVAAAIAIGTAGVIFPSGFYMRWVLARIEPAAFLACLLRPFAYAALMALSLAALGAALAGAAAPLRVALLAAVGAAVYAALLWTRERSLLLSLRGS